MRPSDPSERLAALLGLDYRLLSHHTGLMGTDTNGAISRLRFILAHCMMNSSFTSMTQLHYHSQTECSSLKQRPKHNGLIAVSKPEEPRSPHERQVNSGIHLPCKRPSRVGWHDARVRRDRCDTSEVQVDLIQDVLHGIRTKLAIAKDDIAAQIQQYRHLLPQQRCVSDSTVYELQRQPSNAEPHDGRIMFPDKSDANTDMPITHQAPMDHCGPHMLQRVLTRHDMEYGADCNTPETSEKQDSIRMHSAAQAQLGYAAP